MAYWSYKVRDERGTEFQGYIEALNKKDALAKLGKAGFYLTSLKMAPLYRLDFLKAKNVTKSDLTLFARQFSALISAGIPMAKALYAVGEETENTRLKQIIENVRSDIEGGRNLSESLAKYPTVFSDFFISLIKTGETAGMIDSMLERLASYMEKEEELHRKVNTAFMYPTVVMIVAICVVTYLLVFVVPVFQSVYKGMHVTLPGPTVALIVLSKVIRSYWWLVAAGLLMVLVSYMQLSRMAKGRYFIDRVKLYIPVFGPLNKKVAVSRFVRTFAAMFASGIHMAKGLEVASDTTGNMVISRIIEDMKQSINKGESISKPLKRKKIFPTTVVQMISAGEESGSLDKMLERSADFLDEEVDTAIKRLVIKIEPLLTFMLAFVVGFIALAIYLPMFDVIKQITK